MKIYAVVYHWMEEEVTWPIAFFRDEEAAKKQISMLRNPTKGDRAYVYEFEILDGPRDDNMFAYEKFLYGYEELEYKYMKIF